MNITINSQPTVVPDDGFTVASLLKLKKIPERGTAVALNDNIVCHDCWQTTNLAEGDRVVIISGAFGG